jgi:predicted signal transduction protein with EAL and GGDEF domain
VETAAQVERFAQLGCALAQGYHFARPLATSQLADFLQRSAALQVPPSATTQRLSPSTAELRQRRTARTKRLLLPTAGPGSE